MNIETLCDIRCHLGEGPVWDVEEQALYWADSLGPTVFRYDWAAGTTRRWNLPGEAVGSLAVRRGGGLILAMDVGLHTFDLTTGTCETIAEPFAGVADTMFNDGKVDPAGRFVAGGVNGSVGSDREPQPICPMFCLDVDLSVKPVLEGFACFNGPCFSPDGRTFYVTGRGDMRDIEAISYDLDSGTLGAERVLIGGINPDGATVDADGFVWSAQWDDGCVLRISPDGGIDRRLELPGHVASSVMFGGPELDILFVTTLGKTHWGTAPTATDAGAVFVIRDTGCRGLPERRFEG